MCELLGMNCNVATDICFSFQGFSARGGKTGHHQDGWGIAFFEGAGCRLFVDDKPSVTSPVAAFVKNYPIRSKHVIAHIRKASQGAVALENCHPFRRSLWGRYWVFAHNGDVAGLDIQAAGYYQPVGQTDSEKAFCVILNVLRRAFPDAKPAPERLFKTLGCITQEIARHGIFNYLLSDGESFFAHCASKPCYIVRQAPFSKAHLIDEDLSIDFKSLTEPSDRVAVIATTPLTDNEPWTWMSPGELIAFRDGLPRIDDN